MKPHQPGSQTTPWERLLAWRGQEKWTPVPDAAPDGFAARVAGRWMRDRRVRPTAASDVDLWQVLGLRGAWAAGVVAGVVLLLNLSALRDVGPTLDSTSLNPVTTFFDLSL